MYVCESGRSYQVVEACGQILAELVSRYLGPELLLEAKSIDDLEAIDSQLVWSNGQYL